MKSEQELLSLLHLSLLNKGIYATPRGLYILSTPMAEDDINLLGQGIDEALAELKPFIKGNYPHLTC